MSRRQKHRRDAATGLWASSLAVLNVCCEPAPGGSCVRENRNQTDLTPLPRISAVTLPERKGNGIAACDRMALRPGAQSGLDSFV